MENSYVTLEEIRQQEKEKNMAYYLLSSMISKIRAYRIHFGISQRELAKKSGVTQNIISRMENNLAVPQFETLIKLMQALDLNVDIDIKPNSESEID